MITLLDARESLHSGSSRTCRRAFVCSFSFSFSSFSLLSFGRPSQAVPALTHDLDDVVKVGAGASAVVRAIIGVLVVFFLFFLFFFLPFGRAGRLLTCVKHVAVLTGPGRMQTTVFQRRSDLILGRS